MKLFAHPLQSVHRLEQIKVVIKIQYLNNLREEHKKVRENIVKTPKLNQNRGKILL